VLDRRIDRYALGWLSYTKNSKVCSVLDDDPRACKYKDGILVELGDHVSVFENSATKEAAIEIRDKLRAAGATNWMEGAEGKFPQNVS